LIVLYREVVIDDADENIIEDYYRRNQCYQYRKMPSRAGLKSQLSSSEKQQSDESYLDAKYIEIFVIAIA